jgi:hypothetical protein
MRRFRLIRQGYETASTESSRIHAPLEALSDLTGQAKRSKAVFAGTFAWDPFITGCGIILLSVLSIPAPSYPPNYEDLRLSGSFAEIIAPILWRFGAAI